MTTKQSTSHTFVLSFGLPIPQKGGKGTGLSASIPRGAAFPLLSLAASSTSFIILFIASLLISCSSTPDKKENNPSDEIKYATGFKVSNVGNAKLVEIIQPYQNATSGYHYLLVPKGEPTPANPTNATVIHTPIDNIVCTSTTHIPLLDYINETDKLVGFPTTDYISSTKMRERIDAGFVKELGIDKGMNVELVFSLKPSVVMGYTMTKDLGQLKKIQEAGIPVIINAEYLEKHPLGRAEWIKFMALFFNKEKLADSVFREIEKEYNATQQLTKTVTTKPTVLSGILYGDAWFLPGGKNYAAKLLEDAGCSYLWAQDSTNGFLQLSFESVYAKAKDADLWIGVGSFASLEELKAAEKRYELFKPFQNNKVYSYNARTGAKGGSEFLELGYLRPDLILKDLVKIAYPDLLPEHQLYFHKIL
ncbi:MAG: ABC transporter substrate-binding protein [Cyclobacteriaceae bacterium]